MKCNRITIKKGYFFVHLFLQINIDKDMKYYDVIYHWKAFFISAMQNISSVLIITVKNYINITSFKMKGSPDLGQADIPVYYSFVSVHYQTAVDGAHVNNMYNDTFH